MVEYWSIGFSGPITPILHHSPLHFLHRIMKKTFILLILYVLLPSAALAQGLKKIKIRLSIAQFPSKQCLGGQRAGIVQ